MRIPAQVLAVITLGGIMMSSAQVAHAHHVILTGGAALRSKESMRVAEDQHDKWWANFIRASTIRMQQIRAVDATTPITWIVYMPAYRLRQGEDAKPYLDWIREKEKKFNLKLVWVRTGPEAIAAINAAGARSRISTFDYFGHSNAYCFLLDYSTDYLGASQAWIHQNDLGRIRRGAFRPDAKCQSWGCFTGDSMSGVWKRQLGVPLVGNSGKTDYCVVSDGFLPAGSGRWID